MLIPPSVLIITPFRQILKGVIPKIVSRDHKIFAAFFVHFVKMHIPSFAPGSRRKLWIPAYLMIISQFRDTDSFARKITGIPTL